MATEYDPAGLNPAAPAGAEMVPHGTSSAAGSVTPHEPLVHQDKPEDWGWHHEFKIGRQIGGWFSVLVLVLYLTTTHYNNAGSLALILVIAALVGGLLWDSARRRKQWRQ